METTELLKKRYEVIADYPGSKVDVGDILIQHFFETSINGAYIYVTNTESPLQGRLMKMEYAESMPHLFKELEWWEKRAECDMPDYLKTDEFKDAYSGDVVAKIVIKVKRHFRSASEDWRNDSVDVFHAEGNRLSGSYKGWMPATKEEYDSQNKL